MNISRQRTAGGGVREHLAPRVGLRLSVFGGAARGPGSRGIAPPYASARGFTVVELLIVVAMAGLLSYLAAPFLSTSLSANDAKQSSVSAADALREAQASAMSGHRDSRYGVHFEGTKFVLFRGATYAPADVDNSVHDLTGLVSVSAVSLSPGGSCDLPAGTGNCDVHFENRRGTPSASGTVTFTGAGGETRVVTVNAVGMIDAE